MKKSIELVTEISEIYVRNHPIMLTDPYFTGDGCNHILRLVMLLDKSCFIYGGTLTMELESYLTYGGGTVRQWKETDTGRFGDRQVPYAGRYGSEVHYQLTVV